MNDQSPANSRKAAVPAFARRCRDAWPELFSQARELVVPRQQLKKAIEPLLSRKGQERKWQIGFLFSLLKKGEQDLDWQVDPLTPFVSVPRATPVYHKRHVIVRSRARRLEGAVIAALTHLEGMPPQHVSGALLLHEVLCGGLLKEKLWPLWLGAAHAPSNHGALLWLTLDGKAGHQHWYPGPLSEILLRRCLAERAWPRTAPGTPVGCWTVILGFLKAYIPHDLHPRSRRQLKLWGLANIGLLAPGVVLDFLAGRSPARSLPSEVVARLMLDAPVERVRQGAAEIQVPGADPAPIAVPRDGARQARKHYKKLVAALRGDRGVAVKATQTLLADQSALHPVIVRLGQWSLYLLQPLDEPGARRKSRPVKSATARKYVSALGPGLLNVLSADPVALDSEELADAFNLLLELQRGQKARHDCREHFGRFYDFLVRRLGAAPGLKLPTAERGDVGAAVDANLVTPREVEAAEQQLTGGDPRLSEARVLVMMLGFWCGLRRQEVAGLRLRDVEPGGFAVLHVRPTRDRSLKSEASTRVIPLWCLLPPRILERLENWVARRHAEDAARSPDAAALLFSAAGTATQQVSDAEVFRPVTEALHAVTRDETLRFHHLRHSFGSLLLLRLMMPHSTLPGQEWPAFLRHPSFDRQACGTLHQKLLGPGNEGSGLFAAAALLGHSHLDVSLNSYCHLLDLISGLFLRERLVQRPLDAKEAAGLTGLSLSTVYSCKDSADPLRAENLLEKVRRRYRLPSSEAPLRAQPGAVAGAPPPSGHPTFQQLITLLRGVGSGRFSVGDMAGTLSINVGKAGLWCRRATVLGATETASGHLRHRNHGKFPLLTEPRKADERQLATGILARIEGLTDISALRAGLDLWLNRFSRRRGGFHTSSAREATEFSRFVRLLGVPVRLLHDPTRSSTPEERQRHRREWCEILDLQPEQCVELSAHGHGRRPRGGVVVQGLTPLTGGTNTSEQTASEGFRKGVTAVAIVVGSEQIDA